MKKTKYDDTQNTNKKHSHVIIARIWTGKVFQMKAEEYEQFLRKRAIPDYTSIDGNLGGIILRRDENDHAEFTIITFWESLDSIKAFAGENYEKAKYYEEDKAYLIEFPEKVKHYRVIDRF